MSDLEGIAEEFELDTDESEYDEEFDEELEGEFDEEFYEEAEGEFDSGYEAEFEYDVEIPDDAELESPFSEEEEMELAAELLSITTETELDQFLGKLFKKAWRGIKKVVKGPVGRALGKVLKRVAKVALPVAGRALGTVFGGPVGGMIGGKLASTAGKIFGLELEGLSPEDQEFELAKRFVRLAGVSAKNVALIWPATTPEKAAKAAVIAAARKHAPGLVKKVTGITAARAIGARASGKWIRRGNAIIVLGA